MSKMSSRGRFVLEDDGNYDMSHYEVRLLKSLYRGYGDKEVEEHLKRREEERTFAWEI
jgi:hypothetical protein